MRSPKAEASLAPLLIRGDSVADAARLLTPIRPIAACRGQAGSVPARSVQGLRDGADDLADLVHDLADLVLGDDQGRSQRQRVADGPQHDVVVVEGAVEPGETALAHPVRGWRKVDAG